MVKSFESVNILGSVKDKQLLAFLKIGKIHERQKCMKIASNE